MSQSDQAREQHDDRPSAVGADGHSVLHQEDRRDQCVDAKSAEDAPGEAGRLGGAADDLEEMAAEQRPRESHKDEEVELRKLVRIVGLRLQDRLVGPRAAHPQAGEAPPQHRALSGALGTAAACGTLAAVAAAVEQPLCSRLAAAISVSVDATTATALCLADAARAAQLTHRHCDVVKAGRHRKGRHAQGVWWVVARPTHRDAEGAGEAANLRCFDERATLHEGRNQPGLERVARTLKKWDWDGQ